MPTANCDSPPVVDDDLQNLDWLQNFQPEFLLSLQSDDCSTNVSKKSSTIVVKSEPSVSDKFCARTPSASASFFKHRKPLQCTFNCMIFRAIEASPHKALQLHSIYDWIADKHDYFKTAGLQWRNSVRHSLSLNKCFYRLNIDLPDESGIKTNRSSWWTVHPDFRQAYGETVLDDGPTHRCLPRGVMTGNIGSTVKRLSSSEHELAALANDIKAAAAILTLSQKNNIAIKKIVDDVCNKNEAQKCVVRRRKCANDQFAPTKRRKKIRNGQFIHLVAKNRTEDHKFLCRRRKKACKSSIVNTVTVETQTDEIRIPRKIVDEDVNYEAAVKIEYLTDDDGDFKQPNQDEIARAAKRHGNDSEETKFRTASDGDVDVEEPVDICGAEFLLRLAQEKCPMDQELI